MIKAIIQNGLIVPRDPLPSDWAEGTEVAVDKCATDVTANGSHATDAWMDEVEACARQGSQEDDLRLDAAIQQIREREKERARNKPRVGS
jgi:hypothetical protein